MKTKKLLSGLLLIISISIFTSCSYRVVDFTIISTKNIDLTRAGTFQRGKTRNEGKDVAHIILYFPLGRPSMKEAIDKALEKTSGAVALVDGVVYSSGWWAILYGQDILIVEGTPLIDPSLAMNNGVIPDYSIIKMDKQGKVKDFKEISKNAYLAIKSGVVKDNSKEYFKNSHDLK